MNLKNFIKNLQQELEENPGWGNKEITFASDTGGDFTKYLSVYDYKDENNRPRVAIDIGN